MLTAALAGLAVTAAVGGAAQAQPHGYYAPGGNYAYRYDPPRAYGYDGRYTPYSYYDGYAGAGAALGGALLGAAIAPELLGQAPYDRYGPDPNGMIAADGHRIECKLRTRYDGRYGAYRTRRECR
jgi:hypothetical protein